MKLITSAEMKAIEARAIGSGTVTGEALMESAGRGVIIALREHLPALRAGADRAVVLCGPGNNGGDGFVVARLLAHQGHDIDLFFLGEAASQPADAALNRERWLKSGRIRPFSDFDPACVEGAVVVDALFGTGITRGLAPEATTRLTGMDRHHPLAVIAIDAPSGLCLDSGRLLSEAPRCDLTVTFHAAKPGHFLADGPAHCGDFAIADIGLDELPDKAIRLVTPGPGFDPVSHVMKRGGHKYNHGHALVLGGPSGRGGAARLAARAALRIGAGLVTLGVPASAMEENAARLDAIMLRQIGGDAGLKVVLEDARINALCLGPGLGTGEDTRGLVLAALETGLAIVLDADAITAFADNPQTLFSALHDKAVLTPHGGEFARLFPDLAGQLSGTPVSGPAFPKTEAVEIAAARAGCTLLFKGPDTVIAAPGTRASIHSASYHRSAPWLATAGSGDVLAGLMTGLLARGKEPRLSAELAAWLHVEAAIRFGPGLIAEDIPETLPKVLCDLVR